ncbi:MAG TPA: hypothetical protein VLL08_02875 [Kineosporiaceae bacterium]|nr:hypothetical protein [Kineosporiaceae bacterium]
MEDIAADLGGFARSLSGDSQLRRQLLQAGARLLPASIAHYSFPDGPAWAGPAEQP